MRSHGLKRILTSWAVALAVPLALTFAGALSAQETGGAPPPPPQDQADAQANIPPVTSDQSAHGVARVSVVDGQVTMQRGDDAQWQAATVNLPLMNGDKVATGANSRTEIQLDYANVLRLSDNAQVNLVNLSSGQLQLQLASGTADFVVLRDGGATAEIDTPNMAVHPQGVGVYRIAVTDDADTSVTVRNGTADISTPQGSTTVESGKMIQVQGTDQPQYQIVDAPAEDAWDQWNQSRDNAIQEAKSWNYTDPYYTGSADLDQYGHWTQAPGYGNVWVPEQGPDWAPYSDGRWVWEDYWGWTWVSFEPWGWAPYHYGRWFVYDSAWCWWPGPVSPFYDPIWAPAYVSFFGWGGGFGVGFGFGQVGWLPIGPGDFFHPWWGGWVGHEFGPLGPRGRDGIGSNLGRMMVDGRVRDGMHVMGADQFGRARVSGPGGISLAQLRSAQSIRGALPVRPTAASFRASNRAVSAPNRAAATHFFSSSRMAANGRSGFAARSFSGARGGAQASGNWQRFSAQSGRAGSALSGGARGAGSNWHSFAGSSGGARSAAPRESGSSRGPEQGSGNWQRFSPGGGSRGGASAAPRSGSRPPLNLNRSIMRPRTETAPSRGGRSFSEQSRSYSEPSRGYSAPSRSYSAPSRSYSAPSRSYSGGGGGRSFGGGGGSRSFGGGGGHSGGGGHGRR